MIPGMSNLINGGSGGGVSLAPTATSGADSGDNAFQNEFNFKTGQKEKLIDTNVLMISAVVIVVAAIYFKKGK